MTARTENGRLTELLIEGEARPASSGHITARENPANGQPAGKAAAASVADALAAVAAAEAAFPAWAATPPTERRRLLNRTADIMDAKSGYAEESFGPVKPIIRVRDEDEAVRVANDTEYGLSAAVFSQDVRRAMRVAERIESGIVHINGPTVNDEPQMPFGGVKGSGFGRFGGGAGIAEFTSLRWVTIEDPAQHYPF
ncbi:aldehyde dehydrogenase family protein [Paracoccus sp. S-4012]|uniref:aldehyde dehydrogenase family protein n=1 Tax=Paracoccus sp. S-4012 TaxID=2665648 RepID=UPI0018A1D2C5